MPDSRLRLPHLVRTQAKCLARRKNTANGAFGWRKIKMGALFSNATQFAHEVLAASVTEPYPCAASCGEILMVMRT